MNRTLNRLMVSFCGLLLSTLLVSCGGSGSGNFTGNDGGGDNGGGNPPPTGSNVVSVSATSGATGNSINTLFVTVTVCEPGTATCQTIPNIQVDTGSYGLRLLSSVMSIALPTQTAAAGGTLLECTQFVDGYVWGPVALADVKISGMTASSLPVHVIGDSRFPNVPSGCANSGVDNEEDTVETFGANGILGIGPFVYDCDAACAQQGFEDGYWKCTSSAASSCMATTAALTQQVQSVVAAFTTDNNGVIVDLPAVTNPAAGAASLTGSLIFGIDTETNNASGTQTVLATDQHADITVSYNGQTLTQSFLDSGTNGIYFNDGNLPTCTQSGLTDFYCPTTTQNLTATLHSQSGTSAVVNFSIGNTYTMLSNNQTFAVFPQLGGTYPGTTDTFDFGLPFFYGRRVAVAMENVTTSVGTGPYFAY